MKRYRCLWIWSTWWMSRFDPSFFDWLHVRNTRWASSINKQSLGPRGRLLQEGSISFCKDLQHKTLNATASGSSWTSLAKSKYGYDPFAVFVDFRVRSSASKRGLTKKYQFCAVARAQPISYLPTTYLPPTTTWPGVPFRCSPILAILLLNLFLPSSDKYCNTF